MLLHLLNDPVFQNLRSIFILFSEWRVCVAAELGPPQYGRANRSASSEQVSFCICNKFCAHPLCYVVALCVIYLTTISLLLRSELAEAAHLLIHALCLSQIIVKHVRYDNCHSSGISKALKKEYFFFFKYKYTATLNVSDCKSIFVRHPPHTVAEAL